jgi:hypothetical protein
MVLPEDLGFDHPQAKVLGDFFDDLLFMDKAHDPHGPLTSGTGKRVDFVDLLNQPGPVFSIHEAVSGNRIGDKVRASTLENLETAG